MRIFTLVILLVMLMACHQQEIVPTSVSEKSLSLDDKRVLILLEDKRITNEQLQAIDPNTIESIEVIKSMPEIIRYTTDNVAGIVKIKVRHKMN